MWPHVSMRIYIVLLCTVYFSMLYVFHGRLQYEVGQQTRVGHASNLPQVHQHQISQPVVNGNTKPKHRLLEARFEDSKPHHPAAFVDKQFVYKDWKRDTHRNGEGLQKGRSDTDVDRGEERDWNYNEAGDPVTTPKTTYVHLDDGCFTRANYSKQQFIALEPDTFLYSAYLDERRDKRVIRIMSILSLEKKNRVLEVFCHFQIDDAHIIRKASFYELCENHGKKYGGFMLSCDVPPELTHVCSVNVSVNIIPVHYKYIPPATSIVSVPVTRLITKHVPYNYSICVPPLFGRINTLQFVEFIEMNRLVGVEHFILYNYSIDSKDISKVLDFYKSQNLVTLIDWILPGKISKNSIWYNGQLSAHNDCLYRGMSLTRYLAIVDIDEFIIPHNGQSTIDKSFGDLFHPNVSGLSFESAFYDPNYSKQKKGKKSKLITVNQTGRSASFSKVRTKVMVQPPNVFEVGIHHISKPIQDVYKTVKVNTSVAYLHHYRLCVPNYGMKCGAYMQDSTTMLMYEHQLKAAVQSTFQNALQTDVVL